MVGSTLPPSLVNSHLSVLHPAPPSRPRCTAFYNLFYGLDVLASRLEPLLDKRFSGIAPIPVPSYHHHPRGSVSRSSLKETVAKHPYLFGSQSLPVPRAEGSLSRKKSVSSESLPTPFPSHKEGTQSSTSIAGPYIGTSPPSHVPRPSFCKLTVHYVLRVYLHTCTCMSGLVLCLNVQRSSLSRCGGLTVVLTTYWRLREALSHSTCSHPLPLHTLSTPAIGRPKRYAHLYSGR